MGLGMALDVAVGQERNAAQHRAENMNSSHYLVSSRGRTNSVKTRKTRPRMIWVAAMWIRRFLFWTSSVFFVLVPVFVREMFK